MQTPKLEPRGWRKLLLLGLLLAHGALSLLIDRQLKSHTRLPVPTRLSELRLVATALPAPRPIQRRLPRKQAAAITQAVPVMVPLPQAVVEALPLPTPTPPLSATETSARPALLIDTGATRRAIRDAARQPLLAERAASAMSDSAPLRPEEKLGGQIQQAAVGDCLKGEFAGGGMGLLSAPFWLLAEARSKCRR